MLLGVIGNPFTSAIKKQMPSSYCEVVMPLEFPITTKLH